MQDWARYTVAIITAMVALTFGLTIPPDVCVAGDTTPGGMVTGAERVDRDIFDVCVQSGMRLLVLPEMSRAMAEEVVLDMPGPLTVYDETLQVCESVCAGAFVKLRHRCAVWWLVAGGPGEGRGHSVRRVQGRLLPVRLNRCLLGYSTLTQAVWR